MRKGLSLPYVSYHDITGIDTVLSSFSLSLSLLLSFLPTHHSFETTQ